jgi:hypothetical protein
MSFATAHKLHLHGNAELIAAARKCSLQYVTTFVNKSQSSSEKCSDGEGYPAYGTLGAFNRLRIARSTFYSVVKALASAESRREVHDFLSDLLGNPHLTSVNLAVGVAARHLKSLSDKHSKNPQKRW